MVSSSASYSWIALRSVPSIQIMGLYHWKAVRMSIIRMSNECRNFMCAFSWIIISGFPDSKSSLDMTIYFIQLKGATSFPVTTRL